MAKDENDGEREVTPDRKPRETEPPVTRDLPVWKKALFGAITTVLFFVLLEGGLALFGVRPRLGEEDPLVGFVSSISLFVEHRDADGRPVMVTATNKALKANPGNPVIHSQIGFMRAGWNELEAAAAHLSLACLLWQDNDTYHQQLGQITAQRGGPSIALAILLAACRLNPANPRIDARIERVRAQMGEGIGRTAAAGVLHDPTPVRLSLHHHSAPTRRLRPPGSPREMDGMVRRWRTQTIRGLRGWPASWCFCHLG